MFLLALYAVVVWFLAARFRRRWVGVASVLIGTAACWLAAPGLVRLGIGADAGGFDVLLKAEAALILAVGLFIVALPLPPRHEHCKYCLYDLRGLDAEQPACPECGHPLDHYASLRKTPRARTARRPDNPSTPLYNPPSPPSPPSPSPPPLAAPPAPSPSAQPRD